MDDRNPTSDRLRRLASRYEAGVGRGRAEQIAASAITRAHRRSSTGRKVAVAVSSTAFLLVSLTGVGFAADRAVPGSALYSVDRALEALGLSTDIVEERLQESITLLERGETALAIATAEEALAELGRSGASITSVAVAPVSTEGPAADVSTTTTEEAVVELAAPADGVREDATPTTAAEPEPESATETATATVAASRPDDAVETLRLAAEQLLQSVRSAKIDPAAGGQVTSAAMLLAEATAGASTTDTTSTTVGGDKSTTTSSSTTTSTTSVTTTTMVEEPRPGNNNSGTTTTTVASEPDDGSGSDDSEADGEDDSPGPIFLPTP